jgi:hypothetical protein
MASKVETFWFEILAKKFNLQINHRATSGVGWRRIKNKKIKYSFHIKTIFEI